MFEFFDCSRAGGHIIVHSHCTYMKHEKHVHVDPRYKYFTNQRYRAAEGPHCTSCEANLMSSIAVVRQAISGTLQHLHAENGRLQSLRAENKQLVARLEADEESLEAIAILSAPADERVVLGLVEGPGQPSKRNLPRSQSGIHSENAQKLATDANSFEQQVAVFDFRPRCCPTLTHPVTAGPHWVVLASFPLWLECSSTPTALCPPGMMLDSVFNTKGRTIYVYVFLLMHSHLLCSPIWRAEETDPMHPTPAEAIRAPISYTCVAGCAPQDSRASAANNSSSHQWFQPAFSAFMQGTALNLCCHPRDVRWITQLPYRLPDGRFLSIADLTCSFADACSTVLFHSASIMECLFLEAEHDFLESSVTSVSTGVPCGGPHTFLHELRAESYSSAVPVGTCTNPSHSLMHALQLSAGVAGFCSLAVAVKHATRRALRACDSSLPLCIWHAGTSFRSNEKAYMPALLDWLTAFMLS